MSWGRHRWLGIAAIAAFLLIATGAVLLTRSPSPAQRRSDLASMVRALRSDLGPCNRRAELALTAWQRPSRGGGESEARVATEVAVRACTPSTDSALYDLTVYALPGDLQELGLSYAVSCLGVWAEEDVRPAMAAASELLDDPGNQAAALTFRQDAAYATSNLQCANSTLARVARQLGSSTFQPLSLVSLVRAGHYLTAGGA